MLQTLGHIQIGWLLIASLAVTGFVSFYVGRTSMARAPASGPLERSHSQPNYHGYFMAMCAAVPAALIFILYLVLSGGFIRSQLVSELPDYVRSLGALELDQYVDRLFEHAAMRDPQPTGNDLFDAASSRLTELRGQSRLLMLILALGAGLAGFVYGLRKLNRQFRARDYVEMGIVGVLFLCAAIAILTTLGIILSLIFETIRFFNSEGSPGLFGFLFGTEWNAQTGEDFGTVPLFLGTLLIALLAMCVAAPIGLFSAIYLSEYASPTLRAWIKPILELLAGIPTVVYGFFAAMVVAPAVRSGAQWINSLPFTSDTLLSAQPQSALAAGLVMGIMIIPFVSSLSDDVINAVPQTLRNGALAMGATPSETVRNVVLPAALPGIIAALLLAVSRAIGETMIVVMAAGQRAQITADPTSDLTTITVQIVALLTGDTEFDSAKTLSAFALGFVLFSVTLIFNLIALRVVQRYREKYD
ncbi:MAG: phosphate ABC transporter permease subunit PstC [Henriciella sp.]|nr:phosphate ABC transporter permease subunit PstC [Henriciella sp.]